MTRCSVQLSPTPSILRSKYKRVIYPPCCAGKEQQIHRQRLPAREHEKRGKKGDWNAALLHQARGGVERCQLLNSDSASLTKNGRFPEAFGSVLPKLLLAPHVVQQVKN
jgi:hypothetical protein